MFAESFLAVMCLLGLRGEASLMELKSRLIVEGMTIAQVSSILNERNPDVMILGLSSQFTFKQARLSIWFDAHGKAVKIKRFPMPGRAGAVPAVP
jgi:hypothetical protein